MIDIYGLRFFKLIMNLGEVPHIYQHIYNALKNKIVISHTKNNSSMSYYYYINNKWEESIYDNLFQKQVVEEYQKYYVKHNLDLTKCFKEMEDLNQYLKLLETRLYKEQFVSQLDRCFDLIGFQNGVYDLSQDKFRKSQPSDNLSKIIEYPYKKSIKNELEQYINYCIPDKPLRTYFLTKLSGCIARTQFSQILSVLIPPRWLVFWTDLISTSLGKLSNTIYINDFPKMLIYNIHICIINVVIQNINKKEMPRYLQIINNIQQKFPFSNIILWISSDIEKPHLDNLERHFNSMDLTEGHPFEFDLNHIGDMLCIGFHHIIFDYYKLYKSQKTDLYQPIQPKENFTILNLENYNSEEDSDYNPSEKIEDDVSLECDTDVSQDELKELQAEAKLIIDEGY